MTGGPNEPQIDVDCRGSPRDMGVAQGATLRDKIAGALRTLTQLEAFRLAQPRWLPYRIFRRLAERKARRYLHKPLSEQLPDMAGRLAGLAEGAALRPRALYLLNALEPMLSSVRGCTVEAPLGACSAIAVRGRRSATGAPILARNFDYLPAVQPFYVLRSSRPDGGLRSLDFTVAPLCGTVDGMNERGLCTSLNYAFTIDAGPPAPPISMLASEALARCATVAEAVEWITSRPRCGGGLMMLADATGDIASLELSSTRHSLRRPAAGEDVIFHTNAFFSAAMREVEVSLQAVFTSAAPTPLRGRRVLASSQVRDQRFAYVLSNGKRLGPDEFTALMSDHGANGAPDADSLCMHSSYWSTTASLQFFPRSRRMRVAYDSTCRAKYREFEIA